MKKPTYFNRFVTFKCVGDVLNAVSPNGSMVNANDIETAMSVVRQIKGVTVKNRNKFNVLELRAGNALTSILSAFLLPISHATALDKRIPKGAYEFVKRFAYGKWDSKEMPTMIDENTIIVSVHPSDLLTETIIDIYKNSKAKMLVLMPYHNGKVGVNKFLPKEISETLTPYANWLIYLANKADGKVKFDKKCHTPYNGIIIASKE